MENGNVKRILHAKDSTVKAAYFHNEIINCLKAGGKAAVVNMPEFDSVNDTRITRVSADNISAVQPGQPVFVFEVYPRAALLESFGNLSRNDLYVTVTDFSSVFIELFKKAGFETLYISDGYLSENILYGSVEELNAAVLRTAV